MKLLLRGFIKSAAQSHNGAQMEFITSLNAREKKKLGATFLLYRAIYVVGIFLWARNVMKTKNLPALSCYHIP